MGVSRFTWMIIEATRGDKIYVKHVLRNGVARLSYPLKGVKWVEFLLVL